MKLQMLMNCQVDDAQVAPNTKSQKFLCNKLESTKQN